MEPEQLIRKANERLRAGNVGVAIQQRGKSLWLVATLPPRPGSTKAKAHQQRISLGLRAEVSGIKAAEAKALELRSQLTWGRFDWADWIEVAPVGKSAREWVERYREELLKSVEYQRSPDPEKKWKNEQWHCGLSGLIKSEPVSFANCMRALEQKKPRSRARQLAGLVLTRFAKFCGEDFDLAEASRGYSLDRVERRIPDDVEILEWWAKIPEGSPWRNFYGLLACYGLRPHEAFLGQTEWVELGGDRRVLGFCVPEVCKTGGRLAAPIPREWPEVFGLTAEYEMPKVSKNFGQVGARQFKRLGIPFPPYSLRHRYSLVGNTTQGLGTSTVAALMGHSPATNQRVYQRHLDGPWAWRNYGAVDEQRGER